MAPGTAADLPPRVLLVLPALWTRALLRAELRERGYDALGAPDPAEALAYPAAAAGRGPVRLILVDRDALAGSGDAALASLLERHGAPPAVLLAGAADPVAAGPWSRVIRRPVSIAEIAEVVGGVVPLRPGLRGAID